VRQQGLVSLSVWALLPSGDECSAACWATGVAFYGGIGTLVGTGVDALIKGRKTIYTAAGGDPSPKMVVRPLMLPGVKSLKPIGAVLTQGAATQDRL
jgi:hypothetical protein